MELRLLRYFWTVADIGNISKAAEQLHITQPTLSRQIKELESELESPLFTREKNHLELTEAGLFLKSRRLKFWISRKQLSRNLWIEDDSYLAVTFELAVWKLIIQIPWQ